MPELGTFTLAAKRVIDPPLATLTVKANKWALGNSIKKSGPARKSVIFVGDNATELCMFGDAAFLTRPT